MLSQLQGRLGVYVQCIIHLTLMSTIYKKLVRPSFIWVVIITDSSFVFLEFGAFTCGKTVIMYLHFACEHAQVVGAATLAFCCQVRCCDVRQVVCVEWQAGAERQSG